MAFTPTADAAGKGLPSVVDPDKPVVGTTGLKAKPRKVMKGARTPHKAPRAAWPATGSAVVALGEPQAKAGAPVQAKGLPLELNTPARRVKSATGGHVETRVLGQEAARKAGIDGLLITLEKQEKGAAGAVGATVDYSSFAQAYGGGYASRLTLVTLPACALETPDKAACRTATPVATDNDTEGQTLSAPAVQVRAGTPTVMAVVAGDAGKTGDFKATSLSPSSTWNTDLSSGSFTWSYPIQTPPVPGEFTPQLALSYSSGAIDGRTSSTNNQSSWVGDGFDLSPGYIERRYKPCADDGQKAADGISRPGDLCWGYDNAYVSLNGKGGELVPTSNKNVFKYKNDDGTRIARGTNSALANGDNDNEYWLITTPDGTRYYFGYNRFSGWTEGKAESNSTWTVPVYGDDEGEPCHAATFAESWCEQAWRWNLDAVIDPNGNLISYYYDKETNSYGRNLKAADDTRYTRGGTLNRVEYGLRSFYAKPLARVRFTSSERCIADANTTCADISKDSFYWYDTPWDMNCEAGTTCDKGRLSPTFWTRKRLTGITTEVLDGADYKKVDSWALTHRWGQADIDYQLLLDSIQRTGHTADPAVTLPKTTLAYTQLENRLDKIGDGYAPFIKARLSTIADESGGQTDVNYSAPVCNANSLPTPETNTTRCFPQMIGGTDEEAPERHWFNKYVVTSVTATDRTGGAPDNVTAYTYLGDGAWHWDDDGLTEEKRKTWSQWRGYGQVRVSTGGQGGASAMKSQQDSYFLRGMDGDRKNASGTEKKSVTVALDSDEGEAIVDHEAMAGFNYKTVTYDKPNGKAVTRAINQPWYHQTATKSRSWGDISAYFSGIKNTTTLALTDDGNGALTKWRKTSKSTGYDTVAGRPIRVSDYGETAVADNTCTLISYAPTGSTLVQTKVQRVETVAGDCGSATLDRSKDVISDVRTAYDGLAYGEAPTKGNATATATLKSHNGTTATYLESGTTYDAYGRAVASTDLTATVTATETTAPVRTPRSDGRTVITEFTPATGFATSTKVTTPPAKNGDATTSQTETSTLDIARGLTLTSTDANGRVTTSTYDALGRASKIWLPNRATSLTPSYAFDYFVEEGKPVAVRTLTLDNNGGQLATYTLYDGLLRARQTQAPGPDGGRILADTFYDERGLVAKSFAPYYTTGAPQRGLFLPADALSVETQTRNTYDGQGQLVETRTLAGNGDGGTVLNTTKTIYGGDRTTVIPPQGGTTTTTVVDAQGRATQVRHHKKADASGDYDTTSYQYDPAGRLKKITDKAGNIWTYGYDQMGRQTSAADPDKGLSKTEYDDRGQVKYTEDARGTKLYRTYDGLGRQTETREGTATGALRASWTYDTVAGAKGQLASATRYVDGNEYTSKVTQYDNLYRAIRTAVTIPASEGALAGTYQAGISYKTSGAVAGVSYSAAGSLPGGSYSYSYDDILRPVSLLGDGFRADTTSYSKTGKVLQSTLSSTAAGAKKTSVTNTYEWGTQRLATTRVDREGVNGVDRHNTYTYDQAGNVTSIADVSRTGTDNQCFTYDYLARMTAAWTEGDTSCSTAPTGSTVGGPAPYWHSYTYDAAGNRATETLHDPAGDTAKDTVRTYSYPASGATATRPHAVSKIAQSGPGNPPAISFTYDDAGNTEKRVTGSTTRTHIWDAEGHLEKVTEGDKTTSYLYDTEGNRLIGRTDTETTLYLGGTELVLPKGATKPKATRYIDLGAGNQAVQADDGTITFTLADHLGTGQLAVKAADLSLTQRRSLPFGGPRGTQQGPVWPGTKGYIGGTTDTSTGLTHLGAREYDPTTGTFISVDPLLDPADPQSLTAYSYSNNNPVTYSDPNGLRPLSSCEAMDICPKDMKKEWFTHSGDKWTYHATYQSDTTRRDGSTVWTYTAVHGGSKYVSFKTTPAPGQGNKVVEGILPIGESIHWKRSKELFNFFVFDTEAAKGCVDSPNWGDCIDTALEIPVSRWFKKGYKLVSGADDIADAKKAARKTDVDITCPTPNSFVPGTLVLMADGTTKPIEEVKEGDQVLATDPETGETNAETVTALIKGHGEKHLVKVTIDIDGADGSKTADITATDGHPFWVPELKEWIDATDLDAGEWLQTSAGTRVQITALKRWTAQESTVHNLTVSNHHTYYVLAGQTPVLVHNSNCPTSAANGEKLRRQLAEEAGQLPGIRSADDIFDTPSALRGGVTPDQVKPFFAGKSGWREEGLGRGKNAGGGWVIREYTGRGDPTGRMLRWNPGGGHHGEGAYWRVVGPEGDLGGIIR
ncbi:polymorphic toxin-type HINT domain-containing protein [Streptomyces macrolidinus]|uniref:polymorphic toxin-type HINT domain-containing protein n=1 Tax=Streptomyces macrolidinus TaxID=2952607 RepID=UPI0027E2A466|nr:polymorphic toxin-type HINT domain-containing protein [Streptomyces macrolidinus]